MLQEDGHLRLMRLPEVERLSGLSRSTIYKMISEGTFPRQVRINERAVGWRESELKVWVASRPRA